MHRRPTTAPPMIPEGIKEKESETWGNTQEGRHDVGGLTSKDARLRDDRTPPGLLTSDLWPHPLIVRAIRDTDVYGPSF